MRKQQTCNVPRHNVNTTLSSKITTIRPCHKAAILPRGTKKALFTTLSLIPMVSIARLSVVKQSSFGLPGQYDKGEWKFVVRGKGVDFGHRGFRERPTCNKCRFDIERPR